MGIGRVVTSTEDVCLCPLAVPYYTDVKTIVLLPSLIKRLICECLYEQINQKKLKKYEKEYLVMREQQAQQEDPVERFEVGVDK